MPTWCTGACFRVWTIEEQVRFLLLAKFTLDCFYRKCRFRYFFKNCVLQWWGWLLPSFSKPVQIPLVHLNIDKFKSWIQDHQYHLYQEIGNWGMFESELYWSSVVCLSVCKRFTFSSSGPISTKLGTKHPRVKGILIYSNKGPLLWHTW